MKPLLLAILVISLMNANQVEARLIHVDQHHAGATDDGHGASGQPFKTIQAAIEIVKPGDEIVVHGGVYREMLRPKTSGTPDQPITLRAADSALVTIKGSQRIKDWEHVRGGIWVSRDWPYPSQQVFVNGQPQQQIGIDNRVQFTEKSQMYKPVGSGVEDMFPGSFYYDADEQALYLWPWNTSPYFALADEVREGQDKVAGAEWRHDWQVIEASTLDFLFMPAVPALKHWRIEGLRWEHSNNSHEKWWPAIFLKGEDIIFEGNHVRWMDFGGFEVQGRNIIVRNNLVEWCGALAGSGTNCTNIVVENNVFRYNNYRRFNPGWHSGGVKFTATRDSVFRNNLVHDNWGFGIWLDIDVNNVMVENNIVMNQPHAAGICYEISFNGHVRQNLVINCNRGIWVYSAMGTVVEENLFYDCWQGIVVHGERRKRSVRNYGHPDILVPEQSSYETRDNKVLRNWVLNSRYTDIAIGADDPEQGRANNTAEGNIIWRSTGQFASGGWDGDYRSFDAWQEAGYDRRGRYGNPGIEGIDYQHLKTWLENRIKETVGPTDACDWF